MICQSCGKAAAAVFVTTIVHNKISKTALCPSCAERGPKALSPSGALSGAPSLAELGGALGLLFKHLSKGGPRPRARTAPQRCSCGMRYTDFKKSGRFGCPLCYETFARRIAPILPRIHGGKSRHKGKRPRHAGA